MFRGYLEIDGTEIINAARTKAYVDKLLPDVDVKCKAPGLPFALVHQPYVSPAADNAPWYRSFAPETARFYGLVPLSMEGASDSTVSIDVTELIGDGGVQSTPRQGSKEVRFTALMVAADDDAMEAGMVWLKDALSHGCSTGLSCVGRKAKVFRAEPKNSADGILMERNWYQIETLEGPLVMDEYPSAHLLKIEFTLSLGKAWSFTVPQRIAELGMDTAVNQQDVVGEDCSGQQDYYDDFINDPFFTGISRPPSPPNILPPNILDISSWRRRTALIPPQMSGRSGRAVPIVEVRTTSESAEYVRIRFYDVDVPGATGCDYEGEFLISHVPADSIMRLDSIQREATVTLPSGRVVPGGHLLYGSSGKPFLWPSLGCHKDYIMTVDIMPGQSGIDVTLDVAIRE